jgi:hypothetical protein
MGGAFASENGTLTIRSVAGEEWEVDFDPDSTLEELKVAISSVNNVRTTSMHLQTLVDEPTNFPHQHLQSLGDEPGNKALSYLGINAGDIIYMDVGARAKSYLKRQMTMHSTRAVRNTHTWRKETSLGQTLDAICGPVLKCLDTSAYIFLGCILFFGLVYGVAYGCREWCYEIPESEEGFGTACWFRTYALLPCVIVGIPYQIFWCAANLQPFACPFVIFAMIPFFWIHSILLYPPILLADLNHYEVAHLPLADLAGNPASGIWLTDHETVRVAWELISEANHECLKSKGCGKNCKKCIQYSRTCIAPLVNATEFPVGSAAVGTLINSAYNSLDTAGKPAIQITAWAACDGLKTHCNQLATGTGNVTR